MKILGVDVIYVISPQAKGKVERPYRWLQDRVDFRDRKCIICAETDAATGIYAAKWFQGEFGGHCRRGEEPKGKRVSVVPRTK